MTVNVARTKVMMSERHATESLSFSCDTQNVAQVVQSKSFGPVCAESKAAPCAWEGVIVAGTTAGTALHCTYAEMHIQGPLHQFDPFNASVKPFVNRGCQVWGLTFGTGQR